MEAEPVQQSMLSWIFNSLGLQYGLLLPLLAIVSFVMTAVVVVKGRGPMASAALLLIVPLPMLVGIFGAIEGVIQSYMVIATTNTTPKPSEVAVGISTALVAPMVGMLLMAPSLAIAVFGSFVRSLLADSDRPPNAK